MCKWYHVKHVSISAVSAQLSASWRWKHTVEAPLASIRDVRVHGSLCPMVGSPGSFCFNFVPPGEAMIAGRLQAAGAGFPASSQPHTWERYRPMLTRLLRISTIQG